MRASLSAHRLHGSYFVLWRPVALYAGLGALASGALVGSSADLFDSTWDAVGDFFGLWILVTGVLSAITIPWWLWYAGRTSYVVGAGMLKMLVGTKTVRAWPLGSIYAVRLDPGPSWTDLMTPLNIDGGVFPRVTFRTDVPVAGRPILLWGYDATRKAERELLAAIAASK